MCGLQKGKYIIASGIVFFVLFAASFFIPPQKIVIYNYLTKTPIKTETVRIARITQYGWTGQPMASGEMPFKGAVATSDRSIPLDTIIIINGESYIVKDRTALWVDQKFPILTVDIYSENSNEEMLEFGKKIMEIKIYEN